MDNFQNQTSITILNLADFNTYSGILSDHFNMILVIDHLNLKQLYLYRDTSYFNIKQEYFARKCHNHWAQTSEKKTQNTQGRSPNVQCSKSDFPLSNWPALKGKNSLPYRSSHFENGCNWSKSLLNPVVSLWCTLLFQQSGYAIAGPYCFNNVCIESKFVLRWMLDELTFDLSSYCLILIQIRKSPQCID